MIQKARAGKGNGMAGLAGLAGKGLLCHRFIVFSVLFSFFLLTEDTRTN
jgi:hypothetical protein